MSFKLSTRFTVFILCIPFLCSIHLRLLDEIDFYIPEKTTATTTANSETQKTHEYFIVKVHRSFEFFIHLHLVHNDIKTI